MDGQSAAGSSASSYPPVSSTRRLSRTVQGFRSGTQWRIDPLASDDGFSITEASEGQGQPSTLTESEQPQRIKKGPTEVLPVRAACPTPRLLENTLKLPSMGVATRPPEPSIAPKVTLSSRSRPHAKVVFDQEPFRQRRSTGNASLANSATFSSHSPIDANSLSTSPDTQSTFTNSATGTATVSSPSSSSIQIALPPDASANGVLIPPWDTKGEEPSVATPPATTSNVSPTLARRAAWVKPRSWADLASRMGPSVLPTSASVFSESVGGVDSTPQSPIPSRAQRSRVSSDEKPGRSRSAKGGRRREMSVAEAMKEAESCFDAPLTYPRGMVNTGNMCFANAILQVLMYCAPFYNLFRLLGEAVPHDFHNRTPLMEAVIQFLDEFKIIPESVQRDGPHNAPYAADALRDLQASSEPFVPDFLYDAMKLTKRFDAMRRGHQEDAEEFLGFFLDTLHEELQVTIQKAEARSRTKSQDTAQTTAAVLAVAAGIDEETGEQEQEQEEDQREVNRPASPSEGTGWLEVGQKGKTSFTRTTSAAHSPITRIFGGKLRSVLRTPGSKDSVTLEPYQPLQLDIQPAHVNSIEDALDNLTRPETISGVMSSAKTLVEATKQVFIETLPPVLVLHLKRFYYDDIGGVQKSTKALAFGPTLEIAESTLSPTRRSEAKRRYNLFGVVYHHGRFANGGHYTVDVLRQDRTEWLHIDDTMWATTSVPHSKPSRGAYANPHNPSSAAAFASTASSKPTSPKVANGQLATSMGDAGGASAYLLFYTREDVVNESDGQTEKLNGVHRPPPISARKMAELAAATPRSKASVPGAAPASTRRAGSHAEATSTVRREGITPSSPQGRRNRA